MSVPGSTAGAAGLTLVSARIGWDPEPRRWLGGKRDIDLNVAALMFVRDSLVDIAYHEQLASRDGAVRLLADDVTGEGKGDDEVIVADLTRITPEVTTVLFLVTCYTGQTFGTIENAFFRIIDETNQSEHARTGFDTAAQYTGFVAGKLTSSPAGWQYHPIGTAVAAEHPADAVPLLAPYLT